MSPKMFVTIIIYQTDFADLLLGLFLLSVGDVVVRFFIFPGFNADVLESL